MAGQGILLLGWSLPALFRPRLPCVGLACIILLRTVRCPTMPATQAYERVSHQLDQVSPGPASRFSKPSFCFFYSARLRQRYWLCDMNLTANQTSPRFVKNDRQAFSGKPYVSQDGDLHQFPWSIAMSLPRAGGKQTISTSTCSYMFVLCSDGVLVKRGPSKSSSEPRPPALFFYIHAQNNTVCHPLRQARSAAFPFVS
ncbi:hypothetical protein J3E68DRAFT_264901 [Trichoderma sp. SZMC 28012]